MTKIDSSSRQFPFDDTIFKTRSSFAPSGTVAITAVSNPGGGEVTITAAGHGYQPGDAITQAGTTSYNGDFIVQSVNGDDYNIIDTFVATETGTTAFDADVVGKLLYEGKALPGALESEEKWQIRRYSYDAAGILLGTNFPQGGEESNDFKFIWANRASLTYGA